MLKKHLPSLEKNKLCLPLCFSNSCRIVLDYEVPTSMETRSATFSYYKQRHTFKRLIDVAPNRLITWASSLYRNCTSDKEIVRHCGVLEMMKPCDLIIADKGFLIQNMLPPNVYLILPPFLTQSQFTRPQAELTVRIALSRFHVERAIQRLKTFAILRVIPQKYRSLASKLFQLIACLVNLPRPIISDMDSFPIEQ